MAKLKAAGSRKKTPGFDARAIPCLILILAILVMVSLLFYEILKSGS
jgi:hypothetical protein